MATTTRAGWWLAEVLWERGTPMLRWVAPTGSHSVEPAIGSLFEYDASSTHERRCIGGYSYSSAGASFIACTRAPEPMRRQCDACELRDRIHAAKFHQSHQHTLDSVAPELRERLARPHMLYLAVFRDGSLKVGTSVASRLETRLIEQGAWLALGVLDTPDGLVVRHVEDEITLVDGISQTVHGSRKVAGHTNPRSDTELREALDDATERIAHTLTSWEHHGAASARLPWSNPAIDAEVWQRAVAHPADPQSGNHRFHIVDMCGKVAIVALESMPDEPIAIDVSRLTGIVMGDELITPDAVSLQTSLF